MNNHAEAARRCVLERKAARFQGCVVAQHSQPTKCVSFENEAGHPSGGRKARQ